MEKTKGPLQLYFVALNIVLLFCKFFVPAIYPIAICVFGVSTLPVFGVFSLVNINTISIYIYERYPAYYKRVKTFTLGTQCNLVSTWALFDIRDVEVKSDDELSRQISFFKFTHVMMGLSFVLFGLYALLIFV
jgi:hypothetical protein